VIGSALMAAVSACSKAFAVKVEEFELRNLVYCDNAAVGVKEYSL